MTPPPTKTTREAALPCFGREGRLNKSVVAERGREQGRKATSGPSPDSLRLSPFAAARRRKRRRRRSPPAANNILSNF